MPGLTLHFAHAITPDQVAAFTAAQSRMLHFQDYKSTIELSLPFALIGHVSYPEYPVHYLRYRTFFIALEGKVYGQTSVSLDNSLRSLADTLHLPAADRDNAVRSWALEHDGEYLVVIVACDSREVLLFNDPLGRLPFSYSYDHAKISASREEKFVARMTEAAFDRLGCAELFWLGYPLGQRGLFHNVQHLPAGSIITAALTPQGALTTTVRKYFEANFDDRAHSLTIESAVQELQERFLASCRSRSVESRFPNNVVSLSGGLDSRAVAAALKNVGADFSAVTFLTSSRNAQVDSRIAGQLATALEVPWYRLPLPPADANQQRRLLALTDGHNLVSMAFILPFMDEIVARWNRSALYWTGDGGDKVFPCLTPTRKCSTLDTLLSHIVSEHALVPSYIVETLMQLEPGILAAELRATLSAYPETTLANRAVHYTIYERGHNWLFEGEDRARFFLWQTTPFYSFPFFSAAMRVPDRLKRHKALYRRFQSALCAKTAEIPDATFGLAPNSALFPVAARALDLGLMLPRTLRKKLSALFRNDDKSSVSPAASTCQHSLIDPHKFALLRHSVDFERIPSLCTLQLLASHWPQNKYDAQATLGSAEFPESALTSSR